MRILIVDDHELLRRGIRGIIERDNLGEVCGEATNGLEAIDKVQKLKPDLVLLDVSMPLMGGLEAARRIRDIAPSTTIIVVTMHDSRQIKSLAEEAGADALVEKSEVSTTLVEAIKKRYR